MDIRRSARAVLINSMGRILLFKFLFKKAEGEIILWVTPGGGLKENEDFEEALLRELYEEIGIKLNEPGRWIWTREILYKGEEKEFISHERYFLIKTDIMDVLLTNLTDNEKDTLKDYMWWDAKKIIESSEEFGPADIGKLVVELNKGNIPTKPIVIY